MARLAATQYPLPPLDFSKPYDRNTDPQQIAFDRLMKLSDEAAAKNHPVGFMLSFPVADGHAHYLVTKAKPLTLQHVPYCDAYAIPQAHIRGLTMNDVFHQINQRNFWNSLPRAATVRKAGA